MAENGRACFRLAMDAEGRCLARIHDGRRCQNTAVEGDFCRLHSRLVSQNWQRQGLHRQSEIYGRCDESPTKAHVGGDDEAAWGEFFDLAFKEREAAYVAQLGK